MPQANTTHRSNQVVISVIVPAFNEEHVIGRCIERLATAAAALPDVEVIVVDNGSADETVEIARSYSNRLNLRVVERRGVRIGAVRNYGARNANGTYLAFVDADCLVPPEWLQNALRLLRQNPSALIGAPYAIPPASSWVARTWYAHQEARQRSVSYIPGGDLLISKDAFLSLGGFDERIQTNEDYEFCRRAVQGGMRIRSFPELQVCHLGTPQTLSGFYRKQRWHGKDVFRVFVQSLPRLRNLPSVMFALYTLGCLMGVACAAAIALFSGTLIWFLLFIAALLLAPFGLSLRSALSRNSIEQALPLAVLFLVFGFARAACLVGLSATRRAEARE